jgi:hypothetical protein
LRGCGTNKLKENNHEEDHPFTLARTRRRRNLCRSSIADSTQQRRAISNLPAGLSAEVEWFKCGGVLAILPQKNHSLWSGCVLNTLNQATKQSVSAETK